MRLIIDMIVFLFILGSIIIIHELGHFLAAKYFGVYCGQFSIGFGPKIWSKKGKETEYELRALPFGGFVAMAGEEDQQDNEEMIDVPLERTLKGIKTYKKVIIFFAGVAMNFLLAIVILFGVNITTGQVPVNNAEIGVITEGSAADKAGLKAGDVIQKIDVAETGDSILVSRFDEIRLTKDNVHTDANTITLNMTIQRDSHKKELIVKVDYNTAKEQFIIGVTQATRHMTFTESIQDTFISFGALSMAIISAIGQLVTNFTNTVGQLSGPVGIFKMTSDITQTGQISVLFKFLAMLSINVGLFNLLPIPGLDGCQIIFALVEKLIGRELPTKVKMALQMVGLGLVMLLMAFVVYQDITRLL